MKGGQEGQRASSMRGLPKGLSGKAAGTFAGRMKTSRPKISDFKNTMSTKLTNPTAQFKQKANNTAKTAKAEFETKEQIKKMLSNTLSIKDLGRLKDNPAYILNLKNMLIGKGINKDLVKKLDPKIISEMKTDIESMHRIKATAKREVQNMRQRLNNKRKQQAKKSKQQYTPKHKPRIKKR